MIGPTEAPSKIDVLEAAYGRAKEKWEAGSTRDIFGDEDAPNAPEGKPGRGKEADGTPSFHGPEIDRPLEARALGRSPDQPGCSTRCALHQRRQDPARD